MKEKDNTNRRKFFSFTIIYFFPKKKKNVGIGRKLLLIKNLYLEFGN